MKYLKHLILISLVSFTVACGPKEYIRVTEYAAPPDYLLRDCPVYGLNGPTVKDALDQSVLNKASLQNCNTDKKSLRTWKDTITKTKGNADARETNARAN